MATPPTIHQLVRNKAPFLSDSPEDSNSLDIAIYESAALLEFYLDKSLPDVDLDPGDYDGTEKSLVADIAAIQLVMARGLANSAGVAGGGAVGNTYLKRAQAGSVEAEFGEASKTFFGANVEMALNSLMSSVNMKSCRYGFRIAIENGVLRFLSCPGNDTPAFKVFRLC